MGSQEPSVRVCPEYLQSDGMDAAKILSIGGLILDPWQSDILDDWMARTPSGKWACKTCAGSVPRQNGKTALISGRTESGMVLFNEQVIYTAHLQKTATETFEEMASFFDTKALRKYLKDIKTALGREQIILKSGARVKFLARTRNGGRGQHGDLLIFDEAQELDSDAQASFIPAISASLNPQTIYVGTPPDPNAEGTVFRGIRDKALKGETKTTAWFEYSVKEIGDVTKRERWAQANPALGRRILLSTVEGECEQMDPDTFARERLGWWTPVAVQKVEYAIPEKTWDACASEALKPEGKTAYGVKFSPDGSEVALCGAVEDADGIIRISLIDRRPTGQGTQWLADWLNERSKKACCVVIDGRNGVDVLIDKISHIWRFKGSIIRPSVKDIIASVSMLTDALNEHKLTWYSKQIDLRDSAVTSTKRPISGGWGFGGDNSIPIEACSLAMWGVKTSKRNPSKSMRIG
ncbi:MAG: terminase family protein [Clostridiales bacterium]|nr:terminase family protein [Clostridiales bacterium]